MTGSTAQQECTRRSTAASPTSPRERASRASGRGAARAARARPLDLRVGDRLVDLEGPLLDDAVGEHDDEERGARPEPGEQRRADARSLVGRSDDDRGVVGELGQQARRVAEHSFELAVGVPEERLDLLLARRVERRRILEVVDEEAVPLVGRDTAGARVGMGEVALPLESRHVRTHRGGGDVDLGPAARRARSRWAGLSRCARRPPCAGSWTSSRRALSPSIPRVLPPHAANQGVPPPARPLSALDSTEC